MGTNTLLGLVFMLTGIADLVMARHLGPRIAPAARTALSVFGVGFLLLGLSMALGALRLV